MHRLRTAPLALVLVTFLWGWGGPSPSAADATPSGSYPIVAFDVPAGTHPHDVAPAVDGGVWYTGQASGTLGHLDPLSGTVREIDLGDGSAPHGVIVGPDGAPWITDGGLNAIVRVDPATDAVEIHPLPGDFPDANLNTATFDGSGTLWFTGQSGVYGRFDPAGDGQVEAFAAPLGRGPYGITTTPDGEVWYVSLAGSYLAHIDPTTGEATVIEPPTPGQGARRVWADPGGRLFVSEWNAGQVGAYDPTTGSWREWRLPGERMPQPYAVYVDDRGIVWLSDFGNDAIVRFEPTTEGFTQLHLPTADAAVRQLHGRPGEVWGAGSATDQLFRITTR